MYTYAHTYQDSWDYVYMYMRTYMYCTEYIYRYTHIHVLYQKHSKRRQRLSIETKTNVCLMRQSQTSRHLFLWSFAGENCFCRIDLFCRNRSLWQNYFPFAQKYFCRRNVCWQWRLFCRVYQQTASRYLFCTDMTSFAQTYFCKRHICPGVIALYDVYVYLYIDIDTSRLIFFPVSL